MTYNPSWGSGGPVGDGAVTMTKLASDVTAALNAKAPAATAVTTTDPRLSDARTPTAHGHPQSEVTGLVTALAGKAASTHTHATADITGLDTFLTNFTPTVSATSATTGTMTVTMGHGVRTITPTGACTFNASGGVAGQVCTFAITTSGSSSFTLTWGTNFRRTGTLATGVTTARFFSVTFVCINGTVWQEIARTAVQT